jgi:phosphoserine phosphatase RsbU/P
MRVTLAILRDRLEQRRLWPHSRVARGAWYTLGLSLALFLLQKIVTGFRISSGETLGSWVTFLSSLSIVFFVILAFRFLKAKVLWRLRNRLIVTYMFIAVVPMLLLIGMTFVTLYGLAGQFANFVVVSEIGLQRQDVDSVNSAIAHELTLRMERGEPATVALLDSLRKHDVIWKHRDVCAWQGAKPLPLCSDGQGKVPFAQPLFVNGPFNEIVRDNGKLFLRAATVLPVRGEKLTVVSSEPLDEPLMHEIAKNLGEITLYPSGFVSKRSSTDKDSSNVVPPALFTAGAPPEATNFLDWKITFGTPLPTIEWTSGVLEKDSPGVRVQTRPSVLYDRLFATLGDFAKGVEAILLVIAVVLAIIELLALVIGTSLTRSITGAVAQLYRATQHIDQGDFSHRIPVKSTDQLAQLALSFNSMTASIEKLIIEQKEKQRMENELVIAQEVQAQLFPREISQLKSLEVHGFCRPARTVSGDYYDFLTISSDRMILAAGDVSGKGISAALLMATIHSAVRAYSIKGTPLLREPIAVGAGPTMVMASRTEGAEASPGALLSLLNHQLFESTPQEKYATLFLASYDGRSRKLIYSNGGHLPPIIIGEDGALRRLDQGGMVVGLFDNLAFDEAAVLLRPGDIFIAYSDGITEPENDFGEFGEQRLIDVIQQNRDLPLHEITALVTSAVDDWIGDKEQPDDITLVLARAR